jgi:hypothetical protein
MSLRRRARTFFGGDRYAAFALRQVGEGDASFAGGDVYVAARGVSQSVIPGIDEETLIVRGSNEAEAQEVAEVLLARFSQRELWAQPTIAMELQSYVTQLIYHGEMFVRVHLDRSGPGEAYSLFRTDWLAPETMVRRRTRGGRVVYEQYVSVRAFEGTNYVIDGGPREHLAEFGAEEVLHLRWPLAEPDGERSPAAAALRAGGAMGRDERRLVLASQARAEPEEQFLAVARARAGAFSDPFEGERAASARVKDMLFYPGAYEAAIFPWVEQATEYFLADRALRSRVAICQLREYLFGAFNKQVLARWAHLNGWGELELGLRRDLFSERDWLGLSEDLRNGTIDLEDVRAAIAAENENV